MQNDRAPILLAIDVGGTFTDAVVWDGTTLRTGKVSFRSQPWSSNGSDTVHSPVAGERYGEALAAHPLNDASPDPDLLGMIDAAGRDEVLLGPVEAVAGLPGTYRIWAVMDNLTCGAAVNAVHILEAVAGPVMVN